MNNFCCIAQGLKEKIIVECISLLLDQDFSSYWNHRIGTWRNIYILRFRTVNSFISKHRKHGFCDFTICGLEQDRSPIIWQVNTMWVSMKSLSPKVSRDKKITTDLCKLSMEM